MLLHVELTQTSCHLKIVFTISKSCFKLDVPMARPDQLQTGFCTGQGKMIKSNHNPQSATLLKKGSIVNKRLNMSTVLNMPE